MKNFSVAFFWVFISSSILLADSKSISFEMSVCKEIEFFLSFRFENEKKGIPKKWEDLILIEKMKGGMVNHQLNMAKAINSFALVPGAPVIGNESGVSQDFSGHRLFLISRFENITKNSGSGRCAILIKEDRDSKPIKTFSYFIPENAAKAVLRTIPDFDPEAQPMAFEDLSSFEDADRKFRQAVSDNDHESNAIHIQSRGNRQASGLMNWNKYSPVVRTALATAALCSVGLPLLVFFRWRIRLKNQRN